MLPPDDDYLEDSFGADWAPNEADLSAVLALIPADFYEQLAPLLQLCGVANFLLLGRAADPVPQAITQLTGFNLAAVRRVSRLRNSTGLGRLLLQQPETLLDYILLGQLTFNSPLFEAVRRLLPAPAGAEGDVANCLRDFVVEFSEDIISNLTEFLTISTPTLGYDLPLRRLQLESIFARLEDTLVPMRVPLAEADEPAAPAGAVAGSSGPRLQINFPAGQLSALELALQLPARLARHDDGPFVQALAALPDLQPAATTALRQQLRTLRPAETTVLSLAELCQLYQAAQVCALVLINGAFDALTETSLLLSADLPARHCADLEHFVQLVQVTFPHDATLLAARREVEVLADLL